jgi:hypothetical protein
MPARQVNPTSKTAPQPTPSAAATYLRTLWPYESCPAGYLCITRLTRKWPYQSWFSVLSSADFAAYFSRFGQIGDFRLSIGLSPARPERRAHQKRPKPAQIVAVPGLWADIDLHGKAHQSSLPSTIEEALSLIEEANLPEPTMIVHTGHGVNPYWLFDTPWSIQTEDERHQAHRTVDGLQQTIKVAAQAHGWSVDIVSRLNADLRVPGTRNWHVRPSEPVRVLKDEGPRYGPERFSDMAERSKLRQASTSGSPTLHFSSICNDLGSLDHYTSRKMMEWKWRNFRSVSGIGRIWSLRFASRGWF